MSQEVRLLKLKGHGAELERTKRLPAAAAERLTELNDRWTSTNHRLSTYRILFTAENFRYGFKTSTVRYKT